MKPQCEQEEENRCCVNFHLFSLSSRVFLKMLPHLLWCWLPQVWEGRCPRESSGRVAGISADGGLVTQILSDSVCSTSSKAYVFEQLCPGRIIFNSKKWTCNDGILGTNGPELRRGGIFWMTGYTGSQGDELFICWIPHPFPVSARVVWTLLIGLVLLELQTEASEWAPQGWFFSESELLC